MVQSKRAELQLAGAGWGGGEYRRGEGSGAGEFLDHGRVLSQITWNNGLSARTVPLKNLARTRHWPTPCRRVNARLPD